MSEEKGMYVKREEVPPQGDMPEEIIDTVQGDMPKEEAPKEEEGNADKAPDAEMLRYYVDEVNNMPDLYDKILDGLTHSAKGGSTISYITFVNNTPLLDRFRSEGFGVELIDDHMGEKAIKLTW